VVDALEGYPEDVIDRAELGVSELATNALRHASGGFTVKVSTTEAQLRVEVTDTGDGKPEKRNPAPLDPTGRGLRIVEALSDHWEVTPARPAGKTVAFAMSLAPETSDRHMSPDVTASTQRG
jgi:anti-sigma regulatory factor (Ser/Thr protein kinase)